MAPLLGLDIGTTNIKAVLFDSEAGKAIRIATRPTPTTHPRTDWSEHDPQALWQATVECIREVAASQPVKALAISSMAEAGVLVDPAGVAISPVIAWYDRRSEPQAAWIEQHISIPDLYQITGQRASPSFGVTKLLWLRENMPDTFARAASWLPVPSYLLWRLAGTMAVDNTIASRTLLFDQRKLDWSPEILRLIDLPASFFPKPERAGTLVGEISPQAAKETGLPIRTRCVLGGHDHLCSVLTAGAISTGALSDSTGSANALLLLLPGFLPDPGLAQSGYASYAYLVNRLYVLKGGLKSAGSALEWLARQYTPPGAEPDFAALEAAATPGAGHTAGPIWLPHLIGSGTPQGDRFSRAAVVGIEFEHQPADIFRGLLESLAFWTRQNVEEMQTRTHVQVNSLALTGGATRLKLLSQLKADVLNRPVVVPRIPETAAMGAALLAGLGCGEFSSVKSALDSLDYEIKYYHPDARRSAWYEALYQDMYLPLYSALQPVNHALHKLT